MNKTELCHVPPPSTNLSIMRAPAITDSLSVSKVQYYPFASYSTLVRDTRAANDTAQDSARKYLHAAKFLNNDAYSSVPHTRVVHSKW